MNAHKTIPTPDDFNPKEEVAKVAANLEQPDKFAKIFCAAAQSQKSIDDVLRTMCRELILRDVDTINAIKAIQKDVSKEEWNNNLKRWGAVIMGGILFIAGVVVEALTRKYLG